MKRGTAGTLSGCVVWILSIGIIASCRLPICMIIGSITSFSQYAITATENVICPEGTTAESYSYQTTTTDDFGNIEPAIGVELHCVDQSGTVVKSDLVLYSFLWIGIFGLVGLIVSGILTFAFAAPAGVLIGRLLNRGKTQNMTGILNPSK